MNKSNEVPLEAKQIISEEQQDLMMEDPLTFFVIQQITVGNVRSVERLRELLSFKKGIADRLEDLLERLRRLGFISTNQDKIEIHKMGIRFKPSSRAKAHLIPTLFEIAATRGTANIDNGIQGPLMFMISEDTETSSEISMAVEEFRTKMRAIGEKVKTRKPIGARFVGLVNSPMVGHDYVSELDEHSSETSVPNIRKNIQRMRQAAHDIRPVLGALKVIRKDLSLLDNDGLQMLDLILERIYKISRDFLPAPEKEVGFKPAGLVHSIDKVISERRHCWTKDVTINLDLPSDEIFARIPESELERVLSNLIENAYESYGDAAGAKRLAIALQQDKDTALLTISDAGPGFSETLLRKVKNREFESHKANGTGLGLRFAIDTIESAGGKFDISSVPGAGTEISIRIPQLNQNLSRT